MLHSVPHLEGHDEVDQVSDWRLVCICMFRVTPQESVNAKGASPLRFEASKLHQNSHPQTATTKQHTNMVFLPMHADHTAQGGTPNCSREWVRHPPSKGCDAWAMMPSWIVRSNAVSRSAAPGSSSAAPASTSATGSLQDARTHTVSLSTQDVLSVTPQPH